MPVPVVLSTDPIGRTQTVAPTEEPVSLNEMKLHLRVDIHDENDLVTSLIQAAREYAESFTGRQFVRATWAITHDLFPDSRTLAMPYPPLAGITSVAYLDANGDSQTFSSDDYTVRIDTEPGYIELTQAAVWPVTYDQAGAITITMTSGYADADSVPLALKAAIRLMVGHWFAHREEVITGTTATQIPGTVARLLQPYRIRVM